MVTKIDELFNTDAFKREQLEELLAAKVKLDAEIEERQAKIRLTKKEKEDAENAIALKTQMEKDLRREDDRYMQIMHNYNQGLDENGGEDKRIPYLIGVIFYMMQRPSEQRQAPHFIDVINRNIKPKEIK